MIIIQTNIFDTPKKTQSSVLIDLYRKEFERILTVYKKPTLCADDMEPYMEGWIEENNLKGKIHPNTLGACFKAILPKYGFKYLRHVKSVRRAAKGRQIALWTR